MTRPSIDHGGNPNLFQRVMQLEQQLGAAGDHGDSRAVQVKGSNSRLGPLEHKQLQRAEKYLQLLGNARRRGHLNSSLGECANSTVRTSTDADARLPVGEGVAKKMGRFEIAEKIGHGGFASVFLALDPHTDRRVALKVPRFASLVSSEAQQRFQREARAAAMLSHPAIVPVYEAGVAGPINYIAYEFCPGQTLAQWFHNQNGNIDHMLAASIVARLADAVQHAHRRGVVHRDLKPANVLLARNPDDTDEDLIGNLRITDFGLCKRTAGDEDSITQDGAIIGTPAYMSPEQARSENRVGPASDIYSLGVILYELLTGQRPFDGGSHLETIRAVESQPPRRPRLIDRTIPRTLEAICLKCLRKEPGERYAFAHDLSRELNHWQNDLPVMARRSGMLDRFCKWCRRNPLAAASLGFGLAALLASLAFATLQWQETRALLDESRALRFAALHQVDQLEDAIDTVLGELILAADRQPVLLPHQRRTLRSLLTIEQSRLQQLHGSLASRGNADAARRRVATILGLLNEDLSNLADAGPPNRDRNRSLVQRDRFAEIPGSKGFHK